MLDRRGPHDCCRAARARARRLALALPLGGRDFVEVEHRPDILGRRGLIVLGVLAASLAAVREEVQRRKPVLARRAVLQRVRVRIVQCRGWVRIIKVEYTENEISACYDGEEGERSRDTCEVRGVS